MLLRFHEYALFVVGKGKVSKFILWILTYIYNKERSLKENFAFSLHIKKIIDVTFFSFVPFFCWTISYNPAFDTEVLSTSNWTIQYPFKSLLATIFVCLRIFSIIFFIIYFYTFSFRKHDILIFGIDYLARVLIASNL